MYNLQKIIFYVLAGSAVTLWAALTVHPILVAGSIALVFIILASLRFASMKLYEKAMKEEMSMKNSTLFASANIETFWAMLVSTSAGIALLAP